MSEFGGMFSQPAVSASLLTNNTNGIPGRALFINCTGTGTITVTMSDGTTLTFSIQANTLYQFNWSVLKTALGTATATTYNLY